MGRAGAAEQKGGMEGMSAMRAGHACAAGPGDPGMHPPAGCSCFTSSPELLRRPRLAEGPASSSPPAGQARNCKEVLCELVLKAWQAYSSAAHTHQRFKGRMQPAHPPAHPPTPTLRLPAASHPPAARHSALLRLAAPLFILVAASWLVVLLILLCLHRSCTETAKVAAAAAAKCNDRAGRAGRRLCRRLHSPLYAWVHAECPCTTRSCSKVAKSLPLPALRPLWRGAACSSSSSSSSPSCRSSSSPPS